MNLYNLTNEYLELYNKLIESADNEDGTVDEEIAQMLQTSDNNLEAKLINCAYVVKQLENDVDSVVAEIDRLLQIKHRTNNAIDRLKEGITQVMHATSKSEVKDAKLKLNFRKSERVEILDESLINDAYKTIVQEVKIDKQAIKQAIKQGKTVCGVEIVECQNLQIK